VKQSMGGEAIYNRDVSRYIPRPITKFPNGYNLRRSDHSIFF